MDLATARKRLRDLTKKMVEWPIRASNGEDSRSWEQCRAQTYDDIREFQTLFTPKEVKTIIGPRAMEFLKEEHRQRKASNEGNK